MRDEAPLYWNEKHEFFALSRLADVQAVMSTGTPTGPAAVPSSR